MKSGNAIKKQLQRIKNSMKPKKGKYIPPREIEVPWGRAVEIRHSSRKSSCKTS